MMRKPIAGIVAFVVVLLTMPLGHAAMILMEKGFGHEHVYSVALVLGLIGLGLLIAGILSQKDTFSTFLGLFGGLFVWTGWIEFAFVYYANRFGVEPLVQNGEVVTKAEYLIMPSSVGFWAVFMLYYLIGTQSGCRLFLWFQKKLKIDKKIPLPQSPRNPALATFMEIIMLLWTFYMILLFSYDPNFVGDKHPVTYFVAFSSLLWSLILFFRLIKINSLGYAIRYAIPTVIIFWNFVEILGRWNVLNEIWIEPESYQTELILMLLVLLISSVWLIFSAKKRKQNVAMK